MGMTLDEIKKLYQRRTPVQMYELLGIQSEKINKKIDDLRKAGKLVSHLRKNVCSVMGTNRKAITVQILPEQEIMLGGLNDYSGGRNEYDALLSFYSAFGEKCLALDMNYPVWELFSGERIKNRDWRWPDRYYFSMPGGPDRRPAALYVIGYGGGGYGENDALYQRLTAYIDENGFEICGPAYEEYPVNEIFTSDVSEYLTRLMITVKKRNGKC
jgi:hypothetical protein